MTAGNRLLDRIERTPDVRELLRSSFAFDTGRRNGDGLRLASGAPLEPIAGEFAGGTYFLCPETDGRRPVVYASSEGQGGLIADDLADALEIIVGLDWRDCLGFSGGGDAAVMQVSAQHLERQLARDAPEIAEDRARVAEALSLRVVPVTDLVVRLHEAASRTVPEYVVTTEGGGEYGPLFGAPSEPRPGGWD
ncbi:hypothetical protein [Streptomyces sp. NPDC045470]|uniref:hypothetical protein n=1 Tax=unclassified Streptomyces TaxID=2593676 RepID=UPI0033D40451